jgi:hypothetical protein
LFLTDTNHCKQELTSKKNQQLFYRSTLTPQALPAESENCFIDGDDHPNNYKRFSAHSTNQNLTAEWRKSAERRIVIVIGVPQRELVHSAAASDRDTPFVSTGIHADFYTERLIGGSEGLYEGAVRVQIARPATLTLLHVEPDHSVPDAVLL